MTLLLLLRNNAQTASDSQHAYLAGSSPASDSQHAYMHGSDYLPKPFGEAPVVDNFNRASLGSDWTLVSGTPAISGNEAVATTSGTNRAQYNAAQYGPAIEYIWTIGGLTTTNEPTYGEYDYVDTSHKYYFYISTTQDYQCLIRLGYYDGGGYQEILNCGTIGYSTTSTIRIGVRHEYTGDIKVYLDDGGGWDLVGTTNNSTRLTQGYFTMQWYNTGVPFTTRDDVSIYTVTRWFVHAYMAGQATDSDTQNAYLQGSTDTSDTKHAYLNGALGSSDSQHAYLQGTSVLETDNQNAYTQGSANVTGSQHVYLDGYGERLSPSSDISQSDNWQREDTSTSNLYVSIDEFPENDTDYVWYDDAPIGKYFEVALSDPTGDIVPAGTVQIVWRTYRKAGTQSLTIRVELRQGTTVIASQSKLLTDAIVTHVYTLSSGEKSSITDWTDLRLRFVVEDLS